MSQESKFRRTDNWLHRLDPVAAENATEAVFSSRNLATLPDNALYPLIDWLEDRDIAVLCRLVKSLNERICRNEFFWERRAIKFDDFMTSRADDPSPVRVTQPATKEAISGNSLTWKDYYRIVTDNSAGMYDLVVLFKINVIDNNVPVVHSEYAGTAWYSEWIRQFLDEVNQRIIVGAHLRTFIANLAKPGFMLSHFRPRERDLFLLELVDEAADSPGDMNDLIIFVDEETKILQERLELVPTRLVVLVEQLVENRHLYAFSYVYFLTSENEFWRTGIEVFLLHDDREFQTLFAENIREDAYNRGYKRGLTRRPHQRDWRDTGSMLREHIHGYNDARDHRPPLTPSGQKLFAYINE